MHVLCTLIGHRYDVRANYNNATDDYTHIISSCTRCGKLQILPTNIATKEVKPTKQRTKKPATINP